MQVMGLARAYRFPCPSGHPYVPPLYKRAPSLRLSRFHADKFSQKLPCAPRLPPLLYIYIYIHFSLFLSFPFVEFIYFEGDDQGLKKGLFDV